MTDGTWCPDWEGFTGSPYANWDLDIGGVDGATRGAAGQDLTALVIPDGTVLADSDQPGAAAPQLDHLKKMHVALTKWVLRQVFGGSAAIPLFPRDAVNGPAGFSSTMDLSGYLKHIADHGVVPPSLGQAPLPAEFQLRPDTVIAGVIDFGVPLGHRRTQDRLGHSRILAAWQQSADRQALNAAGEQMYLPFGSEVLAPQLNHILQKHRKPDGYLDEAAFNAETGVEDYWRLFGHRELGRRASHGAHILDAMAGCDPQHPENAEWVDRCKIMAVNFPPRAVLGHAAEYLDLFACLGILRIVALSDALWLANGTASAQPAPTRGYPIVINLSFGKQAGPRDETALMSRFLNRLNRKRADQGLNTVVISVPAGNENLERGNARMVLHPGARQSINWRILPEDQSANFLEVWSEPIAGLASGQPFPITIDICPPGGRPSGQLAGLDHTARTYANPAGLVARVYARLRSNTSASKVAGTDAIIRQRMNYVVALRPTLDFATPGGAGTVARAGVWKVTLVNRGTVPIRVDLNVQTDQTSQPVSAVNQRSYLDVEDYQSHDDCGRLRDSYSYPLDGSDPENLDTSNTLRRHGTLNALAAGKQVVVAAGHRGTDGRMEGYSSTGTANPVPGYGGKAAEPVLPTASMPSRDGAAHFGTLAAGARDGSCVALQGTSFAAAHLTRRLLAAQLAAVPGDPATVMTDLEDAAATDDSAQGFPGCVSPDKAGKGRMSRAHPRDDRYRVNRFGTWTTT